MAERILICRKPYSPNAPRNTDVHGELDDADESAAREPQPWRKPAPHARAGPGKERTLPFVDVDAPHGAHTDDISGV